jgi:FdrA protein
MTGASEVRLLAGAYHDSITLMQVSQALAGRPGVTAAQVAMATDLNRGLMTDQGFDFPAGAGASDLVLAVRADGEEQLRAALAFAEAKLTEKPVASGTGAAVAPRTTGSAARASSADWALISVPGQHAFAEAMDALEAGLDVMIFSDNVPVEQEVTVKRAAGRAGRLVLGPDCGTAIIGGAGLGFANVVRRGPIGIVAASGTGAQQLTCLLDAAGTGISSCLGVGGRDLSAAVGGLGARAALARLDQDDDTERIVVVSKPPDPAVAGELRAYAATLSTPVDFALLGEGRDLTQIAAELTGTAGLDRVWRAGPPPPEGGFATLRGAFAGGTLCDEAMLIARHRLGPIASNIPLPGAPKASLRGPGHLMIDFGDDDLTRGRPHPMIDGGLRAAWLAEQTDPGVVLLLDVVLGHGAAADPAAELVGAVASAVAAGAPVVVSLCGTEADPQGLDRQARALAEAGAEVHSSNAGAARAAVALVGGAR